MKPIEFFLAYRFLKEGKSQTMLIFGGAAVGVAVIVFLTSLILGLQQSIVDTTLGLQPHISVEAEEQRDAEPVGTAADGEYRFSRVEPRPRRADQLQDWRSIVDDMAADPDVVAVAPVASGSGSVIRGPTREPIQFFGVDPGDYQQIIDIEGRLVDGDFRVDDQAAVIGRDMARELDVDTGDRIRLVIADDESRSFTVRGIFDLGASGPNETWAFVSLREAQTMLGIADDVTAIEANVDDLFDADIIAARLRGFTEHNVESWQEANQDLLRALRTQSASTIIISVFVSIAVALGIASVLIVTVVQKQGQVGVLRAMGASMGTILRVFLLQGAAVGLVGSVLGTGLGTALAMGFNQFIRDDTGEPVFPIEPSPTIFVVACLLATITGLLAAVAPARRAARLDPADAITHG